MDKCDTYLISREEVSIIDTLKYRLDNKNRMPLGRVDQCYS